jgi:predicted aconitase with swiveling domain
VFDVRVLVAGRARGRVVVLEEALSFWGGVDPATGTVIDRRHPQAGVRVAGTILAMPAGRGSSSSSTVLAEAIRAGTAPRGIVLRELDGIVALGAIVARELYGVSIPVVVADPGDFRLLASGATATIDGARVEVALERSR